MYSNGVRDFLCKTGLLGPYAIHIGEALDLMNLIVSIVQLCLHKVCDFLEKRKFQSLISLGFLESLVQVIYPLVPRPFLEGQCFFSKFWRRIEGGKN